MNETQHFVGIYIISLNPKPSTNANTNPNSDRADNFPWGCKTKETINRKEIKNNWRNKKEIIQNTLTRTLKKSSWDKSDDDQNRYGLSKCNIDSLSVLLKRCWKCYSTFLKSTTNKETKILLINY